MTGSASPPSAASLKWRPWLVRLGLLWAALAASAAAAQIAYVVDNGKDRSLSVIDIRHDRVLRRIKIGYSNSGLAAMSDNRAVVFGQAVPRDTDVTILDTDSGRRTALALDGPPEGGITISPDRQRAYVNADGVVQAIDLVRIAVVARFAPASLGSSTPAISPDGRTLAVADGGKGGVLLLDAATLKPRARVAAGDSPSAVAWSPSGATLYVGDEFAAGTVAVVDVARRQVTRRIAVGRGPSAIAVARDGRTLYVALTGAGPVDPVPAGAGSLAVVDLARGAVTSRLRVGDEPRAVGLTPDGAKAYVVNRASGTVSVVALARPRVVTTIRVSAPRSGGESADLVAGPDFIAPAAPRR